MGDVNLTGVRPFMRPVAKPGSRCVAELIIADGNEAPRIYEITTGQARQMMRRLAEGLADYAEGRSDG